MFRVEYNGMKISRERAADLLEQHRVAGNEAVARHNAIKVWVRAMIALHQPRVPNRIDLSGLETPSLREALCEKIALTTMRCNECRTPWPCPTLSHLRELNKALGSHGGHTGDGEHRALVLEAYAFNEINPKDDGFGDVEVIV